MPVDRGFVPAYTVQRNAWSRSGMSVTGASFIRPRYQPDCPPGKHAPASRRIHSMQNRTGVLTNGTGTMMDEKNKGRLLAHPGTIASSPGQPVLFHPRFLWSAKARTPMRSGCAAPLAGYEPVGQVADEAGHRRGCAGSVQIRGPVHAATCCGRTAGRSARRYPRNVSKRQPVAMMGDGIARVVYLEGVVLAQQSC